MMRGFESHMAVRTRIGTNEPSKFTADASPAINAAQTTMSVLGENHLRPFAQVCRKVY